MFIFPDWLVGGCVFALLGFEHFFPCSHSHIGLHLSEGSGLATKLGSLKPKTDDIGGFLSERSFEDQKPGLFAVVVEEAPQSCFLSGRGLLFLLGQTAFPGLLGKGTLDLAIGGADFEDIEVGV